MKKRNGPPAAPSLRLYDRAILLLARRSPRSRILGIEVTALLADRKEQTEIFQRVEAALQLIQTYHPLRFSQLQRDVIRIIVISYLGSRGRWNPRLQACEIDEAYLMDSPVHQRAVAIIAGTLVHEATHARLHRFGFGYEEENRARIERICVKAQREFARRLPDGEELAQEYEQIRVSIIGNDFTYTNEEIHEMQMNTLMEGGMSPWMVRVTDWFTSPARIWYPRRRAR